MRKLLLLAALLFPGLGHATISLIQNPNSGNASCSASSSCTLTIVQPTAGDGGFFLLVYNNASQVTISSIVGVGTGWTLCPASACASFDVGTGRGADIVYNLNLAGGSGTSATVNFSGTVTSNWNWYFQYRTTVGAGQFVHDVDGGVSSTSCTSCAGVALAVTGNDVIVQAEIANQSVSAITAPYSNPAIQIIGGTGAAGAINQGSGAAPTWTFGVAVNTMVGVATSLKEAGGAASGQTMTANQTLTGNQTKQ